MDYNKEMKKISGDSVLVETISAQMPTLCKTVGGTSYVVRIHFNEMSKMNVEEKMLKLMGEEMRKME